MDDLTLSLTEFISRFEKFKVDEISIDEAEDDICFNAKDEFDSSPLVSLIGLRYTEDENTIEWGKRKVEYTPATFLPTDFQDLLKDEIVNQCSFLFALHPENINREILSVIGSAHIFVDKKTLKQKLHQALQNWFYNPDAFHKQAESKLTDPRNIEPGFIDKLNEMFKYRGILQDLKQDYEQKNGISPGYCRTEGKYVVEQMLNFDSLYMHNIFSTRSANLDAEWQKMVNKARFENYVVAYNALRLQCESEYDRFMNVNLWKDILEQFCDRTHSQFGIVAIIRATMINVNKEIWKNFLEKRTGIVHKESAKRKNREMQAEANLKKKQMSARDQCVELIEGEFSKRWESLPSDAKIFLAGLSNEDFEQQISLIKNFNVGSSKTTPKKLHSQKPFAQYGVKRIHYQQLLQRKQNFQHHLQLILIQKNTITLNKRHSQAFANKKVSLIKEAQLTPKDQPSNLEVELIHTLLMLPQ